MRARDFLYEAGLSQSELLKHGRKYAEILANLADKGPVEIVPNKRGTYGDTVELTRDTVDNLINFVGGGDLNDSPEFILSNGKTVKGSWGAIFKSGAFTGLMGKKLYNAGHLNELFMGLAVAARFINQNRDVSSDQIRRMMFEASPEFAESRSTMDFQVEKTIQYTTKSKPDNLNFLAVIPAKSAQALLDYGVGPLPGDLASILEGVVRYVNESDSVDAAVARVMKDPNTNTVEIKSDGTSDSKGTKADMVLTIDGSKVSLLSLKTSSSATLGQRSGLSFDAIQYFFKTGFNIDLSDKQALFDPKLGKEKLEANLFKLYDTVLFPQIDALMKMQNPGKESQIVKQLANAANIFARGESLEDVEIVKVNDTIPSGAYKILRYSDSLVDAMKSLDLFAVKVPSKGRGRTIQIFVKPDVANVNQKPVKLCQFRSQVTGGYMRNYFESGEMLDELVSITPKPKTFKQNKNKPEPQTPAQFNKNAALQKSKVPMAATSKSATGI
jgi:hypothetical protein